VVVFLGNSLLNKVLDNSDYEREGYTEKLSKQVRRQNNLLLFLNVMNDGAIFNLCFL